MKHTLNARHCLSFDETRLICTLIYMSLGNTLNGCHYVSHYEKHVICTSLITKRTLNGCYHDNTISVYMSIYLQVANPQKCGV